MRLALTKLLGLWPENVDLDGITVLLRRSPLHRRIRRRVMRGFYETAERMLVKEFVRPGDRVLELGASAGILSCFLGRAAGPDGRVVSVEPNVRFASFFKQQTAANRIHAELIHALCCPLWADAVPEPIRRQQFVPDADSLSGRAGPGEKGTEIPWRTAGEICRQAALEPTVLVADIEGAEAVWADHPPGFPRSVRLVVAEFHPHLTGPARAGAAIMAVLREGFEVIGLSETVLAFRRAPDGKLEAR